MARRRAATYARVSTVRQGGDDRYSLPEQEHGTRTYCEEQGYEHIAHLSEMHTGSELDERPQLTKIRNMIRRRQIDVLVLMQLDRLARDQFHQAVVFYECEQHGVSVELATEKIDDTPFGRYMLLTKGFHAEQQRRDTREKSMRGKRQRVRAGLILATHSPLYGYLWPDDRKSRYVINPEIAPIVQRIFQDVLRGLSTYEIAVALNEEGVLTPLHYQYTRKGKAPPARGAEWQDRTVYAIVTNPAYYGNYEAFKTQRCARNGRMF